jgi:hypothetical protein
MQLETKPWHLWVSVGWVLAFAVWFVVTTKGRLDSGEVPASADLAAWAALVLVQAVIWGIVVFLNLGIHNSLERDQVNPRHAAGFVALAFVAVAAPLSMIAVVDVDMLGSASSSYVGNIIQLWGFLSVVPAMLVIYYCRAISVVGGSDVDERSIQRLSQLHRSVRAATSSLGVVIAIGILVASFAREAMAQHSETFAVESGHILLYGGFFTAFVFALYLYGKSGVDRRAETMIDEAIPLVGLKPADTFLENEKSRNDMRASLGLGTSAREGFQNLVIIASPMLSAILTTFVAP